MPDTFFQVIMRLDGEIYTPELSGDQVTDHATIVKDVADGQFLGEFVALHQIEVDASGKLHAWNITADVSEQLEAA